MKKFDVRKIILRKENIILARKDKVCKSGRKKGSGTVSIKEVIKQNNGARWK